MPDDEFTIRELNLPVIPEDIPESLKDYLRELELVLRQSMKGTLYWEKVFEDGIMGN